MSDLVSKIIAYGDACARAADGRRQWRKDGDPAQAALAEIRAALPHHYSPSAMHMGDCSVCGNTHDAPQHIAQDRTLSTAVALVDKHINAAVRCKDYYKNGVPIGILIQDMRELRERIAALNEKIEPWVPEPPAGWFLLRAAHEHTPIIFNGDTHKPQPHVEGPWVVEFQRLPHGGWLTEGRGRTFGEAWERACVAVARRAAA